MRRPLLQVAHTILLPRVGSIKILVVAVPSIASSPSTLGRSSLYAMTQLITIRQGAAMIVVISPLLVSRFPQVHYVRTPKVAQLDRISPSHGPDRATRCALHRPEFASRFRPRNQRGAVRRHVRLPDDAGADQRLSASRIRSTDWPKSGNPRRQTLVPVEPPNGTVAPVGGIDLNPKVQR